MPDPSQPRLAFSFQYDEGETHIGVSYDKPIKIGDDEAMLPLLLQMEAVVCATVEHMQARVAARKSPPKPRRKLVVVLRDLLSHLGDEIVSHMPALTLEAIEAIREDDVSDEVCRELYEEFIASCPEDLVHIIAKRLTDPPGRDLVDELMATKEDLSPEHRAPSPEPESDMPGYHR